MGILCGILQANFCYVQNVLASTVTHRVIMECTYSDIIYRMLLKYHDWHTARDGGSIVEYRSSRLPIQPNNLYRKILLGGTVLGRQNHHVAQLLPIILFARSARDSTCSSRGTFSPR